MHFKLDTALTFALGVYLTVDTLWSWAHGRAVSGFATTILTLLIIGSFIMISLGVIGEYIAKIYEEVKARPGFLVEEITAEPLNTRNESIGAVKLQDVVPESAYRGLVR